MSVQALCHSCPRDRAVCLFHSLLIFLKTVVVYFILLSPAGETLASGPVNPISPNAEVVATVGDIDFRECLLTYQGAQRKAQCAFHPVYENVESRNGKKIDIFVARLPASNARPAADPILAIAGGPGQAASQAYIKADQMWHRAARARDIYLIDQRGTGRSNFLGCDNLENLEMLQIPDKTETQTLIKDCLNDIDADLRYYSTSAAIHDFEVIREALSVKQWNLIGVSYGTRVVQHYMTRHPSSIRTAVMDSVVPVSMQLGLDIPHLSQVALDELFARCEGQEHCAQAFPRLGKRTMTFLAQLNEQAKSVEIEDINTGERKTVELSWAMAASIVRMYLYSSTSASVLPQMLHDAYTGTNLGPLVRAALKLQSQLQGMFAMGMHNTVLCTEDVAFFKLADLNQRRNQQTYLGSDFFDWLTWTCDVWPSGMIDADFKTPLQSAIPTMLFSGQYDPITPPEYADQVLQGLANAKHVVLPGQAHFVSHTGCAPTMVAKLFDEGTVEHINSRCVERLAPSPVFIDYNGPTP